MWVVKDARRERKLPRPSSNFDRLWRFHTSSGLGSLSNLQAKISSISEQVVLSDRSDWLNYIEKEIYILKSTGWPPRTPNYLLHRWMIFGPRILLGLLQQNRDNYKFMRVSIMKNIIISVSWRQNYWIPYTLGSGASIRRSDCSPNGSKIQGSRQSRVRTKVASNLGEALRRSRESGGLSRAGYKDPADVGAG